MDDSSNPVNIVYKKENMFGNTGGLKTAANSGTLNTFRGSGSFNISYN